MSATIDSSSDDILRLRISGLLKKSELDAIQEETIGIYDSRDHVNSLVILENFEGWERGADWGDMSFTTTRGKKLRKMAIAADPKWETEAMMFVGAGVRRADIRFFPAGSLSAAESWLREP